jgi:hypothetical protein
MKRRIPLPTQAELQALFDYDPEAGMLRWKTDRFTGRYQHRKAASKGDIAGTPSFRGDRQLWVGGKRLLGHRVIWKLMTGEEPNEVDHIDGDPLNNRWNNLRNVTRQENQQNIKRAPKNSGTGILGVSLTKGGRFKTSIRDGARSRHIGVFDNAAEAQAAYFAAKTALHKGFVPAAKNGATVGEQHE